MHRLAAQAPRTVAGAAPRRARPARAGAPARARATCAITSAEPAGRRRASHRGTRADPRRGSGARARRAKVLRVAPVEAGWRSDASGRYATMSAAEQHERQPRDHEAQRSAPARAPGGTRSSEHGEQPRGDVQPRREADHEQAEPGRRARRAPHPGREQRTAASASEYTSTLSAVPEEREPAEQCPIRRPPRRASARARCSTPSERASTSHSSASSPSAARRAQRDAQVLPNATGRAAATTPRAAAAGPPQTRSGARRPARTPRYRVHPNRGTRRPRKRQPTRAPPTRARITGADPARQHEATQQPFDSLTISLSRPIPEPPRVPAVRARTPRVAVALRSRPRLLVYKGLHVARPDRAFQAQALDQDTSSCSCPCRSRWPAARSSTRRVRCGLLSFCLAASAVYALQRCAGRRARPRARGQAPPPIASGRISKPVATSWSALLGAVSLGLAYATGSSEALLLSVLYLAINIAYSWARSTCAARRLPAVGDVLVARAARLRAARRRALELAAALSYALALFIALAKRRADVVKGLGGEHRPRSRATTRVPRPGDRHLGVHDDHRLRAVLDGGAGAVADSRKFAALPFVVFGVLDYLRMAHVKRGGGSPADMLLRSPTLLVAGVGWLGATLWSLHWMQ